MKRSAEADSRFVEHPRYGRRPRVTGLNPETVYGGDTFLHWHSPRECRIPNTAIPADVTRQAPATVQVTHYFDVTRRCRDCGRRFLFFAEEQKHWYEVLGFALEADCVRCVPCRRLQRGLDRKRQRYEDLFHVEDRTAAEDLEMAECCLALIESSTFGRRQLERVRMLIRRSRSASDAESASRYEEILERVRALESRDDGRPDAREPAGGSE